MLYLMSFLQDDDTYDVTEKRMNNGTKSAAISLKIMYRIKNIDNSIGIYLIYYFQ